MSNITIQSISSPDITVIASDNRRMINGAIDVDTTNLVNGSVLIYATNTQKWISTILLKDQIIDSGQY